jgi:hypothetical protein
MASSWAAREEWAERVKENWAAVEVASFSQGLEKLKNVGDKLQETSKKVLDGFACFPCCPGLLLAPVLTPLRTLCRRNRCWHR